MTVSDDILVRPYANLPITRRSERIGYPIKIRIIAWGDTVHHAGMALQRAHNYARCFRYTVLGELTSYGTPMEAAPLVATAQRRFSRKEVGYDLAWWIVPHSAISPEAFTRACDAVRAQWAAEAAARGDLDVPARGHA